MDRWNMESRYGVYATIGRVQKLLCKNDCVTDAKRWSKAIQMQGLYARKSTIEARNMTISSEIGKFLGRNSDLLQIEKGPKRISINMNGKKSPARIWHKTSQLWNVYFYLQS